MRVALFSDIHGNLAALEAVLAALAQHGPFAATVCAGDLVYLGPSPAEVLDRLQAAAVQLVRGNADDVVSGLRPYQAEAPPDRPHIVQLHAEHAQWNRAMLRPEQLELLRGLPLTLRLSPAPGADLLVCHAEPTDNNSDLPQLKATLDELRRAYAGAGVAAVAYGHWHQPYVAPLVDVTLVNVSCVSIPLDGQPLAGYTIAEWHGAFWSFRQYRVAYDLAPEIARWQARGMPRPPWPRLPDQEG